MSIAEAGWERRLGARPSAETLAIALPLAAAAVGIAGLLAVDGQSYGHIGHLVMIVGMTLAMMSPLAIPLGRAVAGSTLWWQARAAVLVALTLFLGLWGLAAAAMHLVAEVLGLVMTQTGAIALLAVGCIAVQIGRGRLRLLVACRVTQPIYPNRHLRSAAHWAGLASGRCMRVCATPMMLSAVQPSLACFAAVAVLLWVERFAARPALRVPLALGYLGIAVALVLTSWPVDSAMPGGHLGQH